MWIWRMRQNFKAQFIQWLNCWLYKVKWGVVMEKNWAHSVDQYQLQALQFSVHLINLLSILLRCNSFARIQKAIVDQNGSTPPGTLTYFSVCKFGIVKCFGASSQSSHWAGHHRLLCEICFSSQVTIQSRNSMLLSRIREDDTSKPRFFLICHQLMRHPLKLFTFPICFKCWTTATQSKLSSFGNFSCSCKKFSFGVALSWWLATSDGCQLCS